jgi:GxxExxY protein
LESAYEACLVSELLDCGLQVERQKALPVVYRDQRLDCGHRIDLLVEGVVVIEIKALETVHPVHRAQLLSYIRLAGLKLGLLINFNVKWLTSDGIHRVVNGL